MKKNNFRVLKLIAFAYFFMTSIKALYAQAPQGLQVDQVAPDFSGKNQEGNIISLKSELQKGPIVLVFYRGEWCPYCNKYLRELELSLEKIKAKGASVIAVTPQLPKYIDKSIEKTKASYSILHDEGLKIMKAYDVAYKLDDATITEYKKYKLDLDAINGADNGTNLPVPAVYVINQTGKISYRFFDPDYTKRAPIKNIIDSL